MTGPSPMTTATQGFSEGHAPAIAIAVSLNPFTETDGQTKYELDRGIGIALQGEFSADDLCAAMAKILTGLVRVEKQVAQMFGVDIQAIHERVHELAIKAEE